MIEIEYLKVEDFKVDVNYYQTDTVRVYVGSYTYTSERTDIFLAAVSTDRKILLRFRLLFDVKESAIKYLEVIKQDLIKSGASVYTAKVSLVTLPIEQE